MSRLLVSIFLMISFSLYGESQKYHIDEIILKCSPDPECGDMVSALEDFEEGDYTEKDLRSFTNKFTHSELLNSLNYEVKKNGDKTFFVLDIVLKREIREIQVQADKEINVTSLLSFFPYKEGEAFTKTKKVEARKIILKYLEDRGFDNNIVKIKYTMDDEYIDILVNINVGKAIVVKDVRLLYSGKQKHDTFYNIQKQIIKFINKPWDRLSFKVELSEISKALFDEGFFQSKLIELKPLRKKDYVILGVELELGKRYGFNFHGNTIFSRGEILEKIRELAKSNINKLKTNSLIKTIEQIYETRGFYHNTIKVREVAATSKNGVSFRNFFVSIKEGKKIKVESVRFFGNSFFTEYKLKKFYDKKGSTLSKETS